MGEGGGGRGSGLYMLSVVVPVLKGSQFVNTSPMPEGSSH